MLRRVKSRYEAVDDLSCLPDDILRIVVEFGTRTLREVLRLQAVNTHFRRAMRQPNKISHLRVELRDFASVFRLGCLAAGVRTAAIRRVPRLESLACFPALKALDLSHGGFRTDLPDVLALTHLRSLNLEFCTNLHCIASLPPQLQDLNVRGCTSLVQLPLELPSLLALNVRHCYRLRAMPSAPWLLKLDAVHCPAPLNDQMDMVCAIKASHQDQYTLSNYTSLQTLSLFECDFERTDFLASLANLTSLRLEMIKPVHFDLSGVSGLFKLQSLDVEGLLSDDNLRSLEGLAGLQSLRLRSSQMSDEGMRSVAKLQELTCLELASSYSERLSHAGIQHLTLGKLTTLSLFACDMTDLASLEGLVRLEHLIIFSSYRLCDLQPLSKLANLKTIKLAYCDSISSLRGLNQLPMLETLDVSHCWDLQRDGLWDLLPCKLSELVLNAHARAQLGDGVDEFHKHLMAENPSVQLIF